MVIETENGNEDNDFELLESNSILSIELID